MADPSSWDILDEDCSDISDWTDGDGAQSISDVNPAGQFRFYGHLLTSAWRYRDLISAPNTFTLEIKTYHDALDIVAKSYFQVGYNQSDEALQMKFASDGLFLNDTDSGLTEVGTNLVKCGASVEWQTWRFLVTFTGTTGDGTCDVYLTDSTHSAEKVGTAIPCSEEGLGNDQRCELKKYRGGQTSHMDYIKIASGLYDPGAITYYIKSVDGVLLENIKSIDGVLLENIKSINGITIQ